MHIYIERERCIHTCVVMIIIIIFTGFQTGSGQTGSSRKRRYSPFCAGKCGSCVKTPFCENM